MTDNQDIDQSIHGAAQGLRGWFAAPPGGVVAEIEYELLREVLANLFGYHIIQIGAPSGRKLIETSRISHQIVTDAVGCEGTEAALVCNADALPFASNSVDVIVLPHTLEFSGNAHGVLREAERVLIGEGHILILAFNPWSVFGLWRWCLGWRGVAPWSGRFLGVTRVKDWLGLLGFEVDRVVKVSFRPPLKHLGVFERLAFLERFGGHFWPAFGNVYMILARKRVLAVRPIKAGWARRRRLPAPGVVEPTARNRPGGLRRTRQEAGH